MEKKEIWMKKPKQKNLKRKNPKKRKKIILRKEKKANQKEKDSEQEMKTENKRKENDLEEDENIKNDKFSENEDKEKDDKHTKKKSYKKTKKNDKSSENDDEDDKYTKKKVLINADTTMRFSSEITPSVPLVIGVDLIASLIVSITGIVIRGLTIVWTFLFFELFKKRSTINKKKIKKFEKKNKKVTIKLENNKNKTHFIFLIILFSILFSKTNQYSLQIKEINEKMKHLMQDILIIKKKNLQLKMIRNLIIWNENSKTQPKIPAL